MYYIIYIIYIIFNICIYRYVYMYTPSSCIYMYIYILYSSIKNAINTNCLTIDNTLLLCNKGSQGVIINI